MGLLDGKVVIVTGGGHGIGRAYCLGIAREGGTAVVADIDEKAAEGVAKAIKDSGGKALGTKVDVANFASCQEMAKKTLDAYGKIDGLINNAAIFMSVPAEKGSWQEITEEAWDRMMAVNVKGVVLVTQAALPELRARGAGAIVNISSISGKTGRAFTAGYAASKFAVVGLTQALAHELGPANIRVNAVCPGLLRTTMWTDGVAPARAYIEDLLPDVLEGRIEPGRVFDRTVDLEDVAVGYRAMADRKAIKVIVEP